MKIALAGNPNSGKTTMYNALTGQSEKVGNWAGVTVDKKIHKIKKNFSQNNDTLFAVDLPGAYSISPFTTEETITNEYINKEKPDVIINIVDSTNLSRSLFFTTQLLELGIPMVVALNKSDVSRHKGNVIDINILSEKLGCPVVETVSTKSKGFSRLISVALNQIGNNNFTKHNPTQIADEERFSLVNSIVCQAEINENYIKNKNLHDEIDSLLTSRWLGIPFFALVMYLVFQISQVWVGTPIADILVSLLENFQTKVGEFLGGANPLLYSLLIDGVIGGVIAVVGFLPLIMVMYFLLALLEDCGYMSRVSVILDPLFKKVGLSGKSVIPFVMGIGCAIPGVMASRTIKDESERRATAMLTPFMPCGAKIPLIALFSGIFFKGSGWVSTVMYLLGIVIILSAALIINKITGLKVRKSFFIIELPEYKFPSIPNALKSMISRGFSYIVKAATIILLCNTAVQIMQSFDWRFNISHTADTSILAFISKPFAYILAPLVSIVSWKLAAATVTGFIAKENVVGTLAVCFSFTNFINADELTLTGGATEIASMMGITKVAALSYLLFNLFSPPCFAAIGAMNSELKSKKWLLGGIILELSVGFTLGYAVNTIGTIITAPKNLNIPFAVIGGIIVTSILITVFCLCENAKRKVKN